MKHAYLIIAHNEFEILQRLISMLDEPEVSFFIHFDRKVNRLPEIRSERSMIHILRDRVDVRWGSVSQILCEMVLFEEAVKSGPFDYYHVISGVTLPLKPFSELDSFFQSVEGQTIVSGLCQDTPYQEKLKVHRYNLFLRGYSSRNRVVQRTSQFLWKSSIAVQRVLHIETNRKKGFFKASNWLSLTDDAVRYVLSQRKNILKTYRFSFCGDEYFIPSELMASPLKEKVSDYPHYLYHEIQRSNAAVLRLADLPTLQQSGYLFARKFTEEGSIPL